MYSGKSASTSVMKNHDSSQKYKMKYRKLRKYLLNLVYENAALCDQITYLQDKILYVKEENNFFTRKLRHIEFLRSTEGPDVLDNFDNMKKFSGKRKPPSILSNENASRTPVKLKRPLNKTPKKRQTLTVSEKASGQLTLPISLSDDLTLQCVGEIVTDRSTFHTEDMIYPVGFVSTRVYANVQNVKAKCSYTCKIIDGGVFPRFEISSDDGLVFLGSSPDECHKKLLSVLNMNYPTKIVSENSNCGADFFGLTNATVHYLILSLPGVSKCAKYSFKKFSEKVAAKEDVKDDIQVCTNYAALAKILPEPYNRDPYATDGWLSG